MPAPLRSVKAEDKAAERRRIERVATNIDALWLQEDGHMPCRMIDVSPTGARLKFADPDTVPDKFEIYVPDFGLRYEVVTRWRDGSNISVQFEKAWRAER